MNIRVTASEIYYITSTQSKKFEKQWITIFLDSVIWIYIHENEFLNFLKHIAIIIISSARRKNKYK